MSFDNQQSFGQYLNLNGKAILVTGGTGSFGKAFIKTVLEKYKIRRCILFSRDELKQYEMSPGPYTQLTLPTTP